MKATAVLAIADMAADAPSSLFQRWLSERNAV